MAEESEAPNEHPEAGHTPLGSPHPSRATQRGRPSAAKGSQRPSHAPATDTPISVRPGASAVEQLPPIPEGEWQFLVDAAISIEVFCEEIKKIAIKWPPDTLREANTRTKAAKELGLLAVWGRACLHKVSAVLKKKPRPASGALAPQELALACRRLQAAGIKKTLQSLVDQVAALATRLRDPYTFENQKRIDEQFLSLSQQVATFTPVAQGVRASLQKKLDIGSADWGGVKVIASVIAEISKLLAQSTTAIGQAWTRSEYGDVLKKRIAWANSTHRLFENVLAESKKEIGKRLNHLLHRDPADARKFECFLESLGVIASMATVAVGFAESVFSNATLGVDAEIRGLADSLLQDLAKLRAAITSLDELVQHYRDVIRRVPFKRQEEHKRPVPWHQLDDRQRVLLAVLVRHRAVDPLGPFYAVSKHTLEQELGLSANNSTLDRDLKDLDTIEIVGKYQPMPSAKDQRPGFGYWVEEYAYEMYGPEVLGKAWTPPREA